MSTPRLYDRPPAMAPLIVGGILPMVAVIVAALAFILLRVTS